jgi:hypothetical protein
MTFDYIIIIPYRNRKLHLEEFIYRIVPIFEKVLKSFKVVIVEQVEGKLFNRGALLNIGYQEYKLQGGWFFNHDVDVYPNEACVEKYYLNHINQDDFVPGFWGIITPPCDTLGTVIKFPGKEFAKCNGYPNNFWGWGVEDKALQNRVELANIPICKVFYHDSPELKQWFEVKNDIDDRVKDREFQMKTHFEYDTYKFLPYEQKSKYVMISGLNTLNYQILNRESLGDHVDLIKVAL